LAVSLWLAFGTFTMLLMPAYHSTAPFFGMLISGVGGTVFYLLLAVVWGYCAWALYRLKLLGWWIIIVAMVLFSISNVITYSFHDLSETYAAMGYSEGQLAEIRTMGFDSQWMRWASVAFTVPILGYLLYIRKFLGRRPEIAPV
jgi:hypothetical protein